MRNYHLISSHHFCPTINLDAVWTLVSAEERRKYAEAKGGPIPVIDVTKAV